MSIQMEYEPKSRMIDVFDVRGCQDRLLEVLRSRFVRAICNIRNDNNMIPVVLPGVNIEVDCDGASDASGASPEVAAADDDDGGDSDGEPARSCPHSQPPKPPPPPATGSASQKHFSSSCSRTARTPPGQNSEFKVIGIGEHDLAKAIGMSVEFLRKDRRGKRLIPFYRIGSAIRYNLNRVTEALASFEVGGVIPKPKATNASQSTLAAR